MGWVGEEDESELGRGRNVKGAGGFLLSSIRTSISDSKLVRIVDSDL